MEGNRIFSDVEIKLKKRNKILFSRDSQCLQDLIKLIQLQNHRALVKWALDCSTTSLEQFEAKYPYERRPRICLERIGKKELINLNLNGQIFYWMIPGLIKKNY